MSLGGYEQSRHSGAPLTLFLITGTGATPVGPYAFNNGESAVTRGVNGLGQPQVYQPWPIRHSDITSDGTLDKSDITMSMARGTDLDNLFLAYPPTQTVNLTIFEGHLRDTVNTANFPVKWMGRIQSAAWRENEMDFSCVPVSTAMRQPGLRRNYQVGCPHWLYGPECGASKAAASVTRQVAGIVSPTIGLNAALPLAPIKYIGGIVEWTHAVKETRTIIQATSTALRLRGNLRGLTISTPVTIIRGCNRQMSDCYEHNNIHNYGGQFLIPRENPLSQKNQFY